jgi:hypothetical protein
MRLSAVLLLASLAATLSPPPALAQDEPHVVLLPAFEGPAAKNTRNRLVKELASRSVVDIVPRKSALVAGKKLGIPPGSTNPSHLAKLGEQMGFDAAITGDISAVEDVRALELTVLFTLDPGSPAAFTYTWEGKVAPASTIVEIADDVVTTLEEAAAPAEVVTPVAADEQEWIDQEAPPPGVRKTVERKQGRVLSVHAGMMVAARKLEIAVNPPPAIEYDGGAFAALHAALAFYPARIATDHPAAGVGLGVSFTRSLALSSQVPGSTVEHDTAFTVLDLELLYELPLGRSPLWLRFDAGWGLSHYTIDTGTSEPLRVRSFSYKNVILGAGLRIDAVDPYLAIEVGGDVRIPHAWGEAETAYGEEAGGVGGSTRLTLSGEIVKGFSWFAGFTYTGMRTTFEGVCGTPDVCTEAMGEKAVDHVIGGWLALGYRL